MHCRTADTPPIRLANLCKARPPTSPTHTEEFAVPKHCRLCMSHSRARVAGALRWGRLIFNTGARAKTTAPRSLASILQCLPANGQISCSLSHSSAWIRMAAEFLAPPSLLDKGKSVRQAQANTIARHQRETTLRRRLYLARSLENFHSISLGHPTVHQLIGAVLRTGSHRNKCCPILLLAKFLDAPETS